MRFGSPFVFFLLAIGAAASHFTDGIAFQRAGKLNEADRELRAAIDELRTSGDRANLVQALSVESWVSVSLGKYADALDQAMQTVQLRRTLGDALHIADDLNTAALASQNLGNYGAALDYFDQALRADRAAGDTEGEITRLNNIGNVHYFEGAYLDALHSYEEAKSKVDAAVAQPWYARRRQLTLANLATIYQRLGKEDMALELYKTLMTAPQAMPARERGQLLLNQGALFRRLGDPVRALELYRSAQELYATDNYSDGAVGALRNIGIARAIDLSDLPGALDAFDRALKLAHASSNRRGVIQASVYRGETLRRMHRLDQAAADANAAIDGAQSVGLVEEQWRALYLLGRIFQEKGDVKQAQANYTQAITIFESIRNGLQTASLRNDFLADKRDVYDALIALRLAEDAPAGELFRWIEQSRARTLNERVSLGSFQDLQSIQARLAPNSIVLDYWTGPTTTAIVWISPSASGIVQHAGDLREPTARLNAALQSGNAEWRDLSRALGIALLAGIPLAQHLIVVPDGPLAAVPFEVLTALGSTTLLIENSDLSYLPSTQFLARTNPRTMLWPWQREMAAWGDPPNGTSDALADRWEPLAASSDEIRSIAQVLPARSEIHLGADAQKRYLNGRAIENVPILHFSTHASIDPENPDRSRILLASDYIFQGEVYRFDLKGVDLVTLSACDTARGKTVRGEGVQAFSRAFLAAGAASTVTSLWSIPDQSGAAFMKQFYYFLSRGETKSQALRSAKLKFLRSRSTLENPRYWAAFVLTGDGLTPLPSVIPWSIVALIAAAILAGLAFVARKPVMVLRKSRQTAATSLEMNPR